MFEDDGPFLWRNNQVVPVNLRIRVDTSEVS